MKGECQMSMPTGGEEDSRTPTYCLIMPNYVPQYLFLTILVSKLFNNTQTLKPSLIIMNDGRRRATQHPMSARMAGFLIKKQVSKFLVLVVFRV
jgi:hypothetical protein